ncbi:MAG: hypothetical protein ACFFD2_00725 [Promethearchaeota archaeon]
MIQIKDLTPNSKNINIVVKLVAKTEPHYAKGHKIVTFTASDPTGQIPIPFWNNDIEQVKVGDYIEIQNGYISIFRDEIQLNIGKYGSFQHKTSPKDFQTNSNPLSKTKIRDDNFTTIKSLEQQIKNLTLHVFVKKKIEERKVRTRRDGKEHFVATFLVGDATGCILLNLWDDWINLIEVGTSIIIHGGYVRVFQGQRFLNISRIGQIEPLSQDLQFNSKNNLSEKIITDFNA